MTSSRLPALVLPALLLAMLCNRPADAQNPRDAQHEGHDAKHAIPQEAVAVLSPSKDQKARGVLMLKQTDAGVEITGKVTGLEPGEHGFHIHEFGDLRHPEGLSAGGHFNPDGHKHGGPDAKERHAGDLGNITAGADGTAQVKKLAKGLKLHFVIGRSMVVHGKADDLKSQPSGDAGPRVALGVIGFAEVQEATAQTKPR